MSTSPPTNPSRVVPVILSLALGFLCGVMFMWPDSRDREPTPGYDPTRNGPLTICGIRPGLKMADLSPALRDSLVPQDTHPWLREFPEERSFFGGDLRQKLLGNRHLELYPEGEMIVDVWGDSLEQGARRFSVWDRLTCAEAALTKFLGQPRFEYSEKADLSAYPLCTAFYPTYGLAIVYGRINSPGYRALRFHLMSPESPGVPDYYGEVRYRWSRAYQAGRATR